MTATASASPSLALTKYWGKADGGVNLPATPSLAATLEGLRTTTTINEASNDEVTIGGDPQPIERFLPLINAIRSRAVVADPGAANRRIHAQSTNDFPTAAGIASSSSGYAALTLALDAFFGTRLTAQELSALARSGSGSAARAVYGGFTVWRVRAESAERFLPASHWPELRLLVVVASQRAKPTSSRSGMTTTRETSPIYRAWCEESPAIFDRACRALEERDLEALGAAMRESYLFMFSTMHTTRPPILYWLPESVAVLRLAEDLRASGVPVWETMDAGPQVKLLTTATHVSAVEEALTRAVPGATVLHAKVGGEPEVTVENGGTR